MSCRTGPLRAGRSLHAGYTGRGGLGRPGPGVVRHDLIGVGDGLAETGRLFKGIDAGEMVLKVEAAEEEGHDRVEGEADRLGAVEVLFKRGLLAEASDELEDPVDAQQKAAEPSVAVAHAGNAGRKALWMDRPGVIHRVKIRIAAAM